MAEQDTSRDDCLARAAECYRLAEEQVGTAKTKANYLHLAWRWHALADESAKATFQPIGHSVSAPT
jgi:hypothetical protein